MRWLYTAFSSSCSPVPSSTGDNRTNNRSVGSYHRRHGTGSMNHRQFTDNDVVPVISRSISTPHILPLPMLSALFKRDSAADEKSTDVFPSREDANKKFDDNRGISNVNQGHSKTPQRLTSLNSSSNTENKESQFLKKCRKKFTSTTSSKDLYSQYETVSAPTTPISNLTLVPSTSKISMSNGIQLQDMTSGFTYHHHRSKYHLDVSSVHSPSSSPLHRKMSIKSQTNQSDNNIQAAVTTVYPLPLPPGAVGVLPSSPPQTCNRPDLVAETSSQSQSQWRKGKLIGRGTFGSVYVGSNRETGALCAMKEVEILPDDPKSAESIKQLQQEIDVLSQLKHPNIVQYYGSEIVKNRFYIYLEYVHPGSINKYVRDHYGGMTESIVRNFTRHIVSGLAYLHSTKTIHRDIKGANLLVDANGVVKLADFGMAKHLDGHDILSLKGSPYWMAPELLHSKPQKDGNPDLALAVDIWSLGCTIIEMMNGKPPWSEHEGAAAMFKVLKETPPIPETMSPDGKDFLRCCFIRNPAERPTAIMLLEHKFLMVQKERVCSR